MTTLQRHLPRPTADPAGYSYTRIDFGSGSNAFTASASQATVQINGTASATVADNAELDVITHQTLSSLTLDGTARVKMAAGTLRELHLNSLTLPSTASLDLNASTLILDYDPQGTNPSGPSTMPWPLAATRLPAACLTAVGTARPGLRVRRRPPSSWPMVRANTTPWAMATRPTC